MKHFSKSAEMKAFFFSFYTKAENFINRKENDFSSRFELPFIIPGTLRMSTRRNPEYHNSKFSSFYLCNFYINIYTISHHGLFSADGQNHS